MTHSLMLRPHEFSQDVGVVHVDGGQSLRAMLVQACSGGEVADSELLVRVGGHEVPAAYWHRLRPKAGTAIHVTRRGLHGGSARQLVAIVAMVALTFFAPQVGLYFGSQLLGVGVMMLGSLAIAALTKPPSPAGDNATTARWNALTGTSNQINPGGVIPFVIGESRFFPPHAAYPYSEAVGESSYQYCLFDLGHGDIEVADIRIGDNPISQYQEVQYEITRTPTLYTNDVAEVVVGASMADGDAVTRTTAPGITRVALDLVAPAGLYGVSTKGGKFDMRVRWRFQYRLAGSTGAWITPASPRLSYLTPMGDGRFEVRMEKAEAFACGIAWDVPAGQYEVMVSRVETPKGSSKNTYITDFTWSTLRSIKPGLPSTTGTNKLAMRIKATDQLNGTLQSLSLVVRQKVRVYDRASDTWAAPAVNLNPAWVGYWLLTACPALSKHVPGTRIHLDTFADYAEFCTINSFEARGVVDAATTAAELIEDLLSCSLGSLGRRDGKYSIVFDSGETLPSMTFTPLEIDSFTMSRPFVRLPQALRVQFKNPAADYQDDEIIVLDDGYSYRGVDARGNPSALPEPTEFETMQLRFAQDAIHAWRVGRFHLAQGKFRSESYGFTSDVAGLGTTRGDVIDVAHDLVEWGAGWGRVVSIGAASGRPTLVLDQMVATQAGKRYSAQLRRQDGSAVIASIVGSGGEADTFWLEALPAGILPGDGCVIGEAESVTEKLLVTGVRYTDGGQVTEFSAVRYDARVAPFWADPPTGIISEITGTTYAEVPVPVVLGVLSDSTVDDPDDAGIVAPVVRIGMGRYSEVHRELRAV
ncbi:hypothetical protein ABB27_02465 [Stenotrophomonas terrae]|uniref:Tip attachment protein J HDII-ins2 domain-containing protein n=1 Tax=Stenotrophomonas terrae TaxID=405446 RepID=A0A0R0CZZ1_9GAMM|nr:hypothetical protein [Stenotrophomonas terrae]KRG71774.1 hypothetical protein ABB27_02465 [Stenotrophomonas terrae]